MAAAVKTIVITGASSGIGRATALRFSKAWAGATASAEVLRSESTLLRQRAS